MIKDWDRDKRLRLCLKWNDSGELLSSDDNKRIIKGSGWIRYGWDSLKPVLKYLRLGTRNASSFHLTLHGDGFFFGSLFFFLSFHWQNRHLSAGHVYIQKLSGADVECLYERWTTFCKSSLYVGWPVGPSFVPPSFLI